MASLKAAIILAFVAGTWACSLPPNTQFYSPTQRTILAPLVIQARVINITASSPQSVMYKACVERLRTFKDKTNLPLPRQFCFGTFGPDYLCLADVYRGREYVFFMDKDMNAKYDGFPQPAVGVDPRTLSMVNGGHCEPRPRYPGYCARPKIDRSKFRSVVRILEGDNYVMSCPMLGTTPMVVKWTKRGSGRNIAHPERQGSIFFKKVGLSDAGTYSCKVYNPAGETGASIRLIVDLKPCGAFIALTANANTTVTSPKYPDYYPRDKMCTWRICPAPRQRLELDFTAFALRRDDRLEIHPECDSIGNEGRTYCSTTSPGTIVSQCRSGCVIMGFAARSSFRPNNEAKGFEVAVTSTNKESTKFDYKKLYCENDLLIRFEPKAIQVSEITGTILQNYKRDQPPQDITIHDAYPKRDLFGCHVTMHYGMQYYIGAFFKNGQYRLRFVLLTLSSAVPGNFQHNLNNYKRQPVKC